MMTRANKCLFVFVASLITLTVMCISAYAGLLTSQRNAGESKVAQPWVAPESARAVKNPVSATRMNVDAGKSLYEINCASCHGEKGDGNGFGAQALSVKPADLTDLKTMKAETDGSLFWKVTNGRGAMPGWKDNFSEVERWQLVDYIQTLAKHNDENTHSGKKQEQK